MNVWCDAAGLAGEAPLPALQQQQREVAAALAPALTQWGEALRRMSAVQEVRAREPCPALPAAPCLLRGQRMSPTPRQSGEVHANTAAGMLRDRRFEADNGALAALLTELRDALQQEAAALLCACARVHRHAGVAHAACPRRMLQTASRTPWWCCSASVTSAWTPPRSSTSRYVHPRVPLCTGCPCRGAHVPGAERSARRSLWTLRCDACGSGSKPHATSSRAIQSSHNYTHTHTAAAHNSRSCGRCWARIIHTASQPPLRAHHRPRPIRRPSLLGHRISAFTVDCTVRCVLRSLMRNRFASQMRRYIRGKPYVCATAAAAGASAQARK